MTKPQLRKIILDWYSAEDTLQSDDDFLTDWVHTLLEETIAGGSDWNNELTFILSECNYKLEGIRIIHNKKGISYMATIDLPFHNGRTRQVSCGTFSRVSDACVARKNAKLLRSAFMNNIPISNKFNPVLVNKFETFFDKHKLS